MTTKKKESDEPVTLTFVAYGGVGQQAMIDAYQKPYTEDHPNVTFVNTSPPDMAQVKTQVESKSVKWDIVSLAPAAATQHCGELFEPLDFSAVDKKDLVDGVIGKCYIGNFINASPFAYRTDAFPDPSKAPKTIADFFDLQKFPNKRGMVTNLQNGILEYPLLADGVAPKDMYPLDVDRSLRKLSTIRKQTSFVPTVGDLQQLVATKQIDMFTVSDSRIFALLNEGVKLTVVWDITVASINGFGVPKGSPKAEAARRFLASVVSTKAVENISEHHATARVNKAAKPNLTDNAKKVEVYGPANTGQTVLQNIDWYAKDFDNTSKKLKDWLAAK